MIKKLLNPRILKTVGRVGAEGAGGALVGLGVERAVKKKDVKPTRKRVVGRRRFNRGQRSCIYGQT